MRLAPLALALALLAVVLAGCSGEPPAAADGGTLGSLDSVEVDLSSTRGAIKGVVVDDAIRPLAGANLTLTPGGQTKASDANGVLVFEGLEPGVYFVAASLFGHAATQASVDVAAGEAESVRLLLAAVYTPQPYHDVYRYQGFMEAYASFASFAVEVVEPGLLPCTCTWTLDPPQDGLTTFVYEADGTTTADSPLPVYGTIYWEFISMPEDRIMSAHGDFPVYQVFKREEFAGDTQNWTVRLTGSQWVHYNTRFDVFVTVWYNSVPPDGWSFIAGDT